MKLFQTKIQFLGHDVYRGTIKLIMHSLEFADKFSYQIEEKKQLQRFLGCLNFVSDYFPNLRIICALLYKRLRKNPIAWTPQHIEIVKQIKQQAKSLPCLGIPHPSAFIIVETDASDVGCGGFLSRNLRIKNNWLDTIQDYGSVLKLIILLLKRKFYPLFYVF